MTGSHVGEASALAAAFLWAAASLLFRRAGRAVPPLKLNLYKGVTAIALLAATLWLLDLPPADFSSPAVIWLLVSGAVGIGIGDSAFFAALHHLGERRTLLLVETLAPLFTVLIAWRALGEQLSPTVLTGIGLILAGITLTLLPEKRQPPAGLLRGLGHGLAAALCQAVGAVLSRQALVASGMAVLWSTLLRLTGGVLLLACLLGLVRSRKPAPQVLSPALFAALLLATFLGTYLGILLQQAALKHTAAGIAQTLLATSPLFVIPLVALQGERVHLRAVGGVLVALAGIGCLLLP